MDSLGICFEQFPPILYQRNVRWALPTCTIMHHETIDLGPIHAKEKLRAILYAENNSTRRDLAIEVAIK